MKTRSVFTALGRLQCTQHQQEMRLFTAWVRRRATPCKQRRPERREEHVFPTSLVDRAFDFRTRIIEHLGQGEERIPQPRAHRQRGNGLLDAPPIFLEKLARRRHRQERCQHR